MQLEESTYMHYIVKPEQSFSLTSYDLLLCKFLCPIYYYIEAVSW